MKESKSLQGYFSSSEKNSVEIPEFIQCSFSIDSYI